MKIELIPSSPLSIVDQQFPYGYEHEIASVLDCHRMHKFEIEIIGELYPAGPVYERKIGKFYCNDESFSKEIFDMYENIERGYDITPPSLLVRIRKAVVWNNMLFVNSGGRLIPLYELYRHSDRVEKGDNLLGRLSACFSRVHLNFESDNVLFSGSAGSFNYGHWLVDDFPLLSAAKFLKNKKTHVLVSGYSQGLNAARSDGIDFSFDKLGEAHPFFVDIGTAYHVENLLYVTPATYHPFIKNPHAMQYARALASQRFSDPSQLIQSKKIFVNRSGASSRRIENMMEFKNLIAQKGFVEVLPEDLSFEAQARIFSGADHVIGVMGAAMANTIFCPPSANVQYLSPAGWVEPFYWDLAGASNHSYSVFYGSALPSDRPDYQKDFNVNLDEFLDFLS